MKDTKKKLLYVSLGSFLACDYLVDLLSIPYYLGIWAVLSIWLFVPVSDKKRCKDCRWFAFDMGDGKSAIECLKWGVVYPCTCLGYSRKWWKFWRSK